MRRCEFQVFENLRKIFGQRLGSSFVLAATAWFNNFCVDGQEIAASGEDLPRAWGRDGGFRESFGCPPRWILAGIQEIRLFHGRFMGLAR